VSNEGSRITFSRRLQLRSWGTTVAAAGLLALLLLLQACTAEVSDPGDTADDSRTETTADDGTDRTLRLAFLEELANIDPDIFYDGEGLQVTLQTYEGLVGYGKDSSEIVPMLAEAWEISDDGITYTFQLREGVLFHDGTSLTADVMIASLERRRAVDAAPAYMVGDIASMSAPDEYTVVIELSSPSGPFLDYLANPWSPKAVSTTAVAENEVDGDLAQGWFASNAVGTGPYRVTLFDVGVRYELEAFSDYWGGEPYYDSVVIEVIPDVSTQRLLLEAGDLHAVTRGLPIEDVEALEQNENLQVFRPASPSRRVLYLNSTSGIFADKALRQQVVQAIDASIAVSAAYGEMGDVPTDFYSPLLFPEGVVLWSPELDTGELSEMIAALESNRVDVGVVDRDGAVGMRMAEITAAQLTELGFDATVRAIPSSQAFTLYQAAPEDRPDALYWTFGGDALHLDPLMRSYFLTDGGPPNWTGYSNAELDAAIVAATSAQTDKEYTEHYKGIAEILIEEALMVPLLDLKEGAVLDARLTDVTFHSFFRSIILLRNIGYD
jgi:peptide/nickel transport system substrate-binding protein